MPSERRDCFTAEKRSEVMRAVGRTDTGVELRLRRALWRRGLRYRKHPRIARARPDICFIGPKVAVFVDGCFWHGCPRHYEAPVGNADFWRAKLRRNTERDQRNTRDLQREGWEVLRFWECEVNSDLDRVVATVRETVSRRGAARSLNPREDG